MHSVESLGKQVIQGNEARRHFEREPLQLAEQIREEATELVLEITESLVTGNPFTVVGEIGDLYILLAQLCEDLGVNPADAMRMKLARNAQKYDSYVTNNGYSREEAIMISKEIWAARGGDMAWSHTYLNFLIDSDSKVPQE